MHNRFISAILSLMLACGIAHAQLQSAGKIVCWKDKAGRVLGCGDKVPPEYQDNATKELNQRGVTVKLNDAALTAEQKKALQDEAERKKIGDQKIAEQQRKDRALLETFTTIKEIDLKRSRDIQQIETNLEAQENNLKNADDRQNDLRARIEPYRKDNRPIPPSLQEEYQRAQSNKAKIQAQIAVKRHDIIELNRQYDETKKRFAELTSGSSDAAVSGSVAKPGVTTPATSAAAAKK